MPQSLDAAAEAAEFAALVAELQAPEADDVSEEAAVEVSDEGETDEESAEPADELEEEEPAEEELEDNDEEELTEEETAAKTLFESGDIKGACKKLGLDPKIFKINARQFTAMRKGLADAAKFHKEGTASKTQGEQLQAKAEEVYGPIVAGFQAYKGGNPLSVRAAIELMCEDTFENVVGQVVRAAKGLDPAQLEVIKLRKELADKAKKDAETASAATVAQQETTELGKLTTLLKSTPLAKVDTAAKEIRDLVLASHKPGIGYGLTTKQAYAQVKAKHAAIAAKFGGKLEAPKAGKAGKPGKPAREELAPVRRDASKPMTVADRIAQKRLDEEAEFKRELAAAKEDTKRGSRAVRRAR
jgi:hypothetical protein